MVILGPGILSNPGYAWGDHLGIDSLARFADVNAMKFLEMGFGAW